jgi:hypothetical protein
MTNWVFPSTMLSVGILIITLGGVCIAQVRYHIHPPVLAQISLAVTQGIPIALLALPLGLLGGWLVGQGLAVGTSPALQNPQVARDFTLALTQGGVARASVPWLMMWLGGTAAAGFAIGLLIQRRDQDRPDPEHQMLMRLLIAGGAAVLGLLVGFCLVSGPGIPTNPVGPAFINSINGGGAALAVGAYHQEVVFGFGDQASLVIFLGLIGGLVGGYFSGSIIDAGVGIVTFVFGQRKDRVLSVTSFRRQLFSSPLNSSSSLWFLTPFAFFAMIAVGFFLWTIVISWNLSNFWHIILTIVDIIGWAIVCVIFFVILAALGVFYGVVNVITNTLQQARAEEGVAESFDWKSCVGAILAGTLLGFGAAIPWLHFLFVDGRLGIAGVLLGLGMGIFLGILPYLKRWMTQWPQPVWYGVGSGIIALGVMTVMVGLFAR